MSLLSSMKWSRRAPLRPSTSLHVALWRMLAALVGLALLVVSPRALAAPFTPPALRGHVVDQAGALTREQVQRLDAKLDATRRQLGFAILVYTLPSLPEGISIEDVGYQAGNAWGVGSKAADDGVLLIWSRAERALRIETGKGVGGALTDVGSSRINREVIGPLLKVDRPYEALDRGVDAIIAELLENTPEATASGEFGSDATDSGARTGRRGTQSRRPDAAPAKPVPMTTADYVKSGAIVASILGVIVLAIVSPTFRHFLFWFLLLFFRGGGRGGGGGFGGGGGGGGSGGGSGYGGGGGSFGGGGSSDNYRLAQPRLCLSRALL